jgi:uncharacterized protein
MIARLHTRQSPTRQILAALFALALIGIAGQAPALAQVQASPPTRIRNPSPAAILIAKQIIDLKGAKQTLYAPLVRGVIEKVKDQFMQTNFMWGKDLNAVAANMEKEYASRADELVDESARVYASYFTEAELRQILAFYQTPLGRKVIRDEPKVLDESMSHAGQWSQTFAEQMIDEMRKEMKKRGHDL